MTVHEAPTAPERAGWQKPDEVVAADCGLAIEYSKDALRVAIRALQADPAARERMGRNALRLAREKYNWSRDEAALLEAYRGIIPVA